MTNSTALTADELREWLDHVRDRSTARWLMIAIAHEEGVDVGDLADWYDLSDGEIRDWLSALDSRPVVTIAEAEGVSFEELADGYGLAPETIRQWFDDLESEPIEQAAVVVDRYSQRDTAPVVRRTESRVEYLDYTAIDEHGWAIDDDDLFEKASKAGLDPSVFGRILVEPGETILEAAENRNLSWPYACRGGACANCAVLVKSGDVAMPGNHVLSDEQVAGMNARLTCVGVPVTDRVKLVMNVQGLDQFEGLRLPSPLSEGGSALP
ncbi:ferredoxin Fer [Halorubrum sp. DTA98]|uniref:ferredoxin Fer n=1 Tax=Halorubrum sp. DTA98 TaxID=3402163 RepID=UPI003AAEA20B